MIGHSFAASPLVPTTSARQGWRWHRLTELARLATGHTPSRRHPEYWDGDIPWIQLPDIRALDGETATDTSERINDLGIQNSAAVLLPTGTVCLSRTASVGFVTIMGRPMATSQDFVNWVCGPNLDPHFLMYLLMANRQAIRDLGSGAVHQTVYFPTVESFSVCVPELKEQRRLARNIAEQLASADAAMRASNDRLAAAELLPAAYISKVFENPDARGWMRRQVGEVAPVQTGFAFKSAWFVQEGGVRVLRNANIHQGFIDWSDLVCVRGDVAESFGAFALNPGDIVLTLDRPLVASGLKVARVEVRDRPALLNQRVARFRVNTSALDIEYLYLFLRSPAFSNAIRGHDQSLGVPHISPSQVERVEIPLPSLMTQKRLVSELKACLSGVGGLVDSCRDEAAAIEALPRTYLQEAFEGAS